MHKSLLNILALLAIDFGIVTFTTMYNEFLGAAAALYISRNYVAAALDYIVSKRKAAELKKSFEELGVKFYEL